MWVVMEGPDGTGKSTLAQNLKGLLEGQGLKVVLTKEPGSPEVPVCTQIRQILLDPNNKVSERTSLLLFLADRAQHMLDVVIPTLEAGKVVISDRSSLSTWAYQVAGNSGTKDHRFLSELLAFGQRTRRADLCLINSADYDWAKTTLAARGGLDRIEQKGDAFHRSIHKFFSTVTLEGMEYQDFMPRKLYRLPGIPDNSANKIAEAALSVVLENLNLD